MGKAGVREAVVRKASVWPPDPLLVPVRTQPFEPILSLSPLEPTAWLFNTWHPSAWSKSDLTTAASQAGHWIQSIQAPRDHLHARDKGAVVDTVICYLGTGTVFLKPLGVSGCQWPTVQESILAHMFSWIFPVLCCLLFGMKLRTQPSSFSGRAGVTTGTQGRKFLTSWYKELPGQPSLNSSWLLKF